MNKKRASTATIITIIVSVIFHAAVLYYVASTWGIIPTAEVTNKENVVIAVPPPPPPPPPPPETVVQEKPRFRPRPVPPPPVAVKVPPAPLKAQPPAPSTADATTMVSDKEVIDSPISKSPPRYPPRALEGEKEGKVELSITINPDGSVGEVRVVSASPAGYFEDAAVTAVKKWRYRATGRTIADARVEVTFKLE